MRFTNLSRFSGIPLARTIGFVALLCSASCGGGGSMTAIGSGTVDVATAASPRFDLDGFKFCGIQGDTLDLKVKTHVAFGLKYDDKNNDRLVYLYAQTGKLLLQAEVFGNDPIPSKYKQGFCKVVTADNNDAVVFAAALDQIKAHLDGTAVLSLAQLQDQNDRIVQTTYTLADNKSNIDKAFSVLAAYEVKEKGPFFINAKTKTGFPNFNNADGFELDRAVLAIQQSIFDYAYTPASFGRLKETLRGKKFNSSDWYPGPVKVPAVPGTIYTAKINATMAKDVDLRTAFSQSFARRPTGYYLAAGDIATVTVPAAMVGSGFVIRVGANVVDKYIKSAINRPFRISNQFPIVSATTEIANPNGGGIYIDVPYLASAGNVSIKIQNAVPAPFFSTTTLNNVTLQQWQDIQRKNPAPWADFESDKYMMTVPTRWIYNYADPVALMTDWDNRMDAVSDLVGRPRVRNNPILYLAVDTNLSGDAFSIGYPTGNNTYSPASATDGNSKNWFLTPGKGFSEVEFHELGHAQLFGSFPGSGEADVNLLSVAVSNKVYGVNIDEALGKSMSNLTWLGRELAAVDWMVTPNFRAGKAMDITNSTKNEVRYQQRGYAKHVEMAALFGWDKVGAYFAKENSDYRDKLVPEGKSLAATDGLFLRMSIAAGVDLRPLIHFWGVQPVDSAALSAAITAANLKPSALIYDRLKFYQTLIPMNNATFQTHAGKFLNKSVAQINGLNKSPDYAEGWYAFWLNLYGNTEGQAAQAAMEAILKSYFPNGRP